MCKLFSLVLLSTTALLVHGASFPMTPEESAYVIVHYELDMTDDLLSWANTETNKQLQALDKLYADAGLELRVSFSYSQAASAASGEFYMGLTQDMTVEEYVAEATQSLEAFTTNYTKSTASRRINNVLAAGVEMFKYEAPATRRVLIIYTNVNPTPFGSFDGDALSPYTEMTSNVDCSQELIKTRLTQNSAGVLLVALASTTAAATTITNQMSEQYTTVIPDFGIDGNVQGSLFDSIEHHLARLLSPGYLATTSTTTAPNVALCVKEAVAQCMKCSA